jgi:hypothetical protein
MHRLFDLATLWEYLPLERRNLIEIVKIKNVTRRTKEAVVLSPDQFREFVRRLSAHVNVIAITMSCPGLRVSEALGLRWGGLRLPAECRPDSSQLAGPKSSAERSGRDHSRRNDACLHRSQAERPELPAN